MHGPDLSFDGQDAAKRHVDVICLTNDKAGAEAQKKAMKVRTGILHRLAPRQIRTKIAEESALEFLEGMQSPPPDRR